MAKSVTIYGTEYKPQVGSHVLLDGRSIGENLRPGDAPDPGVGYSGSEFRYPSNVLANGIPVNIDITGRTKQAWVFSSGWGIRVKVTFVGHGEPDTHTGGWLKVD